MAYQPSKWEKRFLGNFRDTKKQTKEERYKQAFDTATRQYAKANDMEYGEPLKTSIRRYYDTEETWGRRSDFFTKQQEKRQDARKKEYEKISKDNPSMVNEYRKMGGTEQYMTEEDYNLAKRWQEYYKKQKEKKEEANKKKEADKKQKDWSSQVKIKEGSILDKTGIGSEFDRFFARLADSLSIGGTRALEKKSGKEAQDNVKDYTETRKIGEGGGLDMLATGLGYLAPGVGSAKLAKLAGAGAKLVKGGSILKNAGQLAKEGAAAGAILGAAETPSKYIGENEETAGDTAKRIALEAGAGAVLDPLVHGATEGIGKLLSKLPKSQKAANTASTTPNTTIQPYREPSAATSVPKTIDAVAATKTMEPVLKTEEPSVTTEIPANQKQPVIPEGVQAMASPALPLPKAQVPLQGTAQTKPITRQQILNNMKKNLGVTIRTGRLGIADDAVRGIFKQNPEVIRSRAHGDLQVISHEIGHHLDKQFNLANPQYDQELMALGARTSGQNYTPDQVRAEGLAEYIRLHLVDPQQAAQQAPQFTKYFNSTIPEKTMKGLQQTQSDIAAWINQGEALQFRGQINRREQQNPVQKIQEMLQNIKPTGDKAYTELVDKLHPLAQVEKEINGGKLADASESLYKKARLAAGTPRVAEQKLQELKPIFDQLQSIGRKKEDLGDYMAALHARDLESMGIESGFTPEQINAVIQQFDSPEMQAIQQEVRKYQDSLLDILVDGGILSKEAVNAMRQKYPNYVPFFRHFEEEMQGGLTSKGFVDLTNPVKRLKGSTRDIIDPLESIIKNTFAVVQAVEKNKVGLELDRLAQKSGAGKYIEKLDGKQPVRNEQIVTVYKDGEKVQYQLAPELYRAMKSMDKEVANTFVKVASQAANVLRAGATLTPEFMLRNPIRDQFAAYAVSDVGYNPLDFLRGLKEVGKKRFGKGSQVYDEWVKQGGAYGGYLSSDRDILAENLRNLTTEGSKLQRVAKGAVNPTKWLEVLQKGSEISEEATKVGAYKKGLKKGLTPEESAFQARDLMDFNRVGNSMQPANLVYAFLNANVQGKDKLIRAFKQNPVRTASRIVGATVPPTALAVASQEWANEKQKEIMDNMPQWERDTYWAFAVPGTDEVLRIPKPFDISAIPNAMEKAYDYVANDNPYAFEGEKRDLGKDLVNLLTPTALKPIVEGVTNYSFFTGGPVVPQRDQINSPKNQYGPNSSLTSRVAADALDKVGLDVSPYALDNAYRGYTAGLGQYPLKGLDALLSLISNKERPTQPAQDFTESAPGIKAFFVNDQKGGKVMDDYYRVMEEQQAIQADAKDAGETPPNATQMKAFNKINKQMNDLRAEYRKLQQDTKMPPKEKRAEMDRLNKEMREVARQGILIFRPDYQ